jgi:translation elongation factor EF-Tu-like GTPase
MKRKVIGVRLALLATERGGREGAVLSGYRSLARFEGIDGDFGFELHLEGHELAPGAAGHGRLSFWAPAGIAHVSKGQRFEVLEGTRVIGYGTVSEPGSA